MKGLLMAVALVCFGSLAQAQSLDLYPVGKNFGSSGQWQFGIDKSAVVGACVQRELHDGQWLAGPCKDVFILAKNGQEVWHLGGAVMYNAEHGNAVYELKTGVVVGRALQNGLAWVGGHIPLIDDAITSLSQYNPPKFLAYAANITKFDVSGGYRPSHNAQVQGNWGYGGMVTLNIPLDDVYALLKAGF
jgi:hypothetical protein